MEDFISVYRRDKKIACLLFLVLLLFQVLIGVCIFKCRFNILILSNTMYIPIVLAAFFFTPLITTAQVLLGSMLLFTSLHYSPSIQDLDVPTFCLINTISYFFAGFLVSLFKLKLESFYQRREEVFFIDEFTGLPNLSAFIRDVEKFFKHQAIIPHEFLLIEIYNQHEIEVAYGLDRAYQIHAQLADTLRELFEDQIAIYQIRLNSLGVLFPTHLQFKLEELRPAPRQVVYLDDIPIFIDFVAGECTFPTDAQDAEGLLQKSYLAQKEAERLNRIYYRYDQNIPNSRTFEQLGQIQEAIIKNDIDFYYQPILDRQDRIANVEALVRWSHPQRGMIAPSDFIPDLELTGMANLLLIYSLDYNLHRLRLLHDAGFKISLSLNISVTNLQQTYFSRMVLEGLRKYDIAPQYLTLEITEHGLLQDMEESNRSMNTLVEKGITFHIDDFGTGFTSIGNLRKLGIQSVKMDRSFVQDVLENEVNQAVITNLNSLTKAIGISTVAEGVEKPEVYAYLKKIGIDYYQGFCIAHPMPFAQLKEWLLEHTRGQEKK